MSQKAGSEVLKVCHSRLFSLSSAFRSRCDLSATAAMKPLLRHCGPYPSETRRPIKRFGHGISTQE